MDTQIQELSIKYGASEDTAAVGVYFGHLAYSKVTKSRKLVIGANSSTSLGPFYMKKKKSPIYLNRER